jgi:hypothetical protein
MNREFHRVILVASFVLFLGHQANGGGPPNPTLSDADGNTAGGSG